MAADVAATPPHPDLEVSVLGPLRARAAGVEVTLGGRRQRAVLARLALAAGRVVAAERLVDELWLGEPPPSAANTLQSYVSNLRRILRVDGSETPVIERVGEGYRLALDEEALTAVRFDQLLSDGTHAGDLGVDVRLALLDQALALWHGPAVADFADEPWAQGDAVRLEEMRLAAMEGRFQLLLDLGRHAVVVGDLESAVAAHPLRERFTALLVLALYRCGRQAEALRAYERTRSHFGEELGLDPSPELVRLAAQVLDHDPALAAPDPPPSTAAAGASATPGADPESGGGQAAGATAATPLFARSDDVPPPRGALDLPPAVLERRSRGAFVGRARELANLTRHYQRVDDGDRRLVAVTGEAGMGKTRLAQQFATWVHDQGGHVMWGRCTAENLIAYQPAVEALRTALRSISGARSEAMLGPRPALGLLLPDLMGERAGAPSRAERYELYEALADVVGIVAASAPVVFVVDDIQWADPSTLGLVDHLVRSDTSGRLLVVATQRRPAGRPTIELETLYADLRRDQRFGAVDLVGVEADEVASLLGAHGVDVNDEVALALHARTGGNPFFLESLAGQGGDLRRVDARELPDSVRDLLDQRLAGLAPEAASVLHAAAVIGLRVDLALLGAVAELPPDELLDVVDAAVAAGLLAEDEDLGWVTFPHALVRQALVARTTRNREARLHMKVADALEARPELLDRASSVAQHLLAAGRLCPAERAASAALAAGRDALAVFADAEARTWARRATDVLGTSHQLADLRAEADLLDARASRDLGDRDAALAAVDRAVAHARGVGDRVLLARAAEEAALAMAGFGFRFGAIDEALVSLLDEALRALPADGEGDDDLLARRATLLAFSSIAGNSATDRVRPLDKTTEALAIAERLGRDRVTAIALLARRLALAGPRGLEERRQIGPGQVVAAEEAQWSEVTVIGHVLNTLDLLESYEVAAAEDEVELLAKYVAPFGRPAFDAYVLFLEANLHLLRGNRQEAEARSARAVELGEPAHAGNAFQTRAGQQFLMAREAGVLGEILPIVQAMAEANPNMAAWSVVLATCCAAVGDLDGARAAYEPVITGGILDVQGESTWNTSVSQLAEVVWTVGDAETAAYLVGLVEPYVDRLAMTAMGGVCSGPFARSLGLARAAAGDLDGAIEVLDGAAARCAQVGLPIWQAKSEAELAVVLRRRGGPGDEERAADLLAGALAVAEEHGVHLALHPDEYGEEQG